MGEGQLQLTVNSGDGDTNPPHYCLALDLEYFIELETEVHEDFTFMEKATLQVPSLGCKHLIVLLHLRIFY